MWYLTNHIRTISCPIVYPSEEAEWGTALDPSPEMKKGPKALLFLCGKQRVYEHLKHQLQLPPKYSSKYDCIDVLLWRELGKRARWKPESNTFWKEILWANALNFEQTCILEVWWTIFFAYLCYSSLFSLGIWYIYNWILNNCAKKRNSEKGRFSFFFFFFGRFSFLQHWELKFLKCREY